MSDQVFVMSQVFVILDFLSSLKTPILHILPDHSYVLLKYEYQFFWRGKLFGQAQEFI
jgi:hypothetical protein